MNDKSGNILFDKFEIIECFKKDAHSSVYLATHIYLGKKIILKTLNTNDLSDQTVLGRFKREAKILAQLDHPNLIKVLDFGTHEDHFYISFEYFKSRNLREVIKQNNLSEEDKLQILVQLLKALNIAHQNKIIHRDIKPENILLDSDNHLKIADFGLALIQTEDMLTHDTSIVGTPSYMSPEQLRGEKTLQTDIFSTGIVTYELYSGSNPFSGNTVSDTVNKILNYNENSATIDYNKLPEKVRDAVISMLRKNQKDRAKSVLEVLQLLGIQADIYEPIENKKNSKIIYKIYLPAAIIVIVILIVSSIILNRTDINNDNTFGPTPAATNLSSEDSAGTVKEGSDSNQINTQKIINDKKPESSSLITNKTGKLFVECTPYADVYLDGKKVDTTPIKDYIELVTGKHTLKLENPNFPSYVKNINIRPDRIESITLNFNDIVGYMKCNIFPWGEVYINGELKGITPMPPVVLLKGKYDLSIKHSKYEPHKEKISINIKDTLNINFNFEKSGIPIRPGLKTE